MMKINIKSNIEIYLHKIDASFKGKTQKDIYMTFIMVFSSIFAFSYLLYWDVAEKEYLQKTAQVEEVLSKIQADNLFLQYNPESKVVRLDKNIRDANSALIRNKENNKYIKGKLKTISALIYNEKAWGEYIHSISTNAKKYNIKIIDFTNQNVKNNQSFGHMLDINIKSIGNFKNTLLFINSLEQSELVVDIHEMNIKTEDVLVSDLNLSVWGILF